MQYEYGLLNFRELLDAQTSLLNSRSSLLNNQSAVLNSWVQLYRSLGGGWQGLERSEEHTSELQSRPHLVCRLLLEKKKKSPVARMCVRVYLNTHMPRL